MFPLRDHNPSGRTPYVTYALILANVAVFMSYYALFDQPQALEAFFFRFGFVPAYLDIAPLSVISSMFLHGSIMHIFGNMLFLWIFGDNLEDKLGHLLFAAFYLAGGVAAAMLQYATEPQSTIPMVGASGAIATVLGGYFVLFPKARVDILIIIVIIIRVLPVPAWMVLGVWLAIQLIQGAIAPADTGGVAYWAHTGGFVAGMVMILPIWLRLGGPAFWRRHGGHPPHPEARYRFQKSSVPRVPRMPRR
mgnify:CR=1 FL=1